MRNFFLSRETWVTSVLMVVCAVFYIDARSLPEGSFDPLGAGAAPEMVAAALIALCAIILVRSFVRACTGRVVHERGPIDILERTSEPSPRSFIHFVVLLLLFVLAFQFEIAHFIVVTTVFVFLATLALAGWSPRAAIIAGCLGIGISVTLFLVLTKFFVIRLPGAF